MVGRKIFCAAVLSVLTAAAFADEPAQRCPCCGQTLPPGVTVTNPVVSARETSLTCEKSAPRDWKASVYGGFSAKSGNTKEEAYNYGGDFIKQDGSVCRYMLRGDGRYRKAFGKVSDSKADLSGEMRRLFTEKWFISGRLSAEHDDLKDLSYRVKAGPGIGRYLADSDALRADVSTGLLYTQEKSAGERNGYVAWRLSQRVDWQLTETFKVWEQAEFFMSTMDTANYQIAFQSGVESKISRHLSLVVSLTDDYDNLPDNRTRIEKNDFAINTGLRYVL